MACNNCGNSDVELIDKKTDGQGFYEREEYRCNNCGEVYEWVMKKEIIKQGKEQEN